MGVTPVLVFVLMEVEERVIPYIDLDGQGSPYGGGEFKWGPEG